jgi:putative SOS response-associated peptidase YedK
MCGRFNVSSSPLSELLIELVGLPHPGPDNYNAAPTETISVVRIGDDQQLELVPMRWWLTPFWAKEMSSKYSMFNAKSETLEKSPAFREPYKKRRCVVPVSGFYEWARATSLSKPGANAQKLPYYLTPHEAPGMLLAGIWDRWHNKGNEKDTEQVVESFAVLTCPANERLEFVHKRQPVMLNLADAHQWLDPHAPPGELAALFDSALPVELDAIPVSSYVNNARHKDARCFDPIANPVSIAADGSQ